MNKYKLYVTNAFNKQDCIRNGFINLVSRINEYDKEVVKNLNDKCTKVVPGHLSQLGSLFPDDSFTEINISPSLNTISPPEFVNILQSIKVKLANNGVLNINFVDISRVAIGISNGSLNLEDIHALTIGKEFENKSILDCSVVRTLLEKLQFQIESISFEDKYFGVISAINNK